MPLGGLAIAGGLSLASGVGNYFANKDAQERASMLQDKAFQEFLSLHIPDPKDQELILERFVLTGEMDPKLEQAIKQEPSAFESIVENHEAKQAQLRALGELEDIGYSGGLRLQDKAAIQDAMLEGQVKDRGNRMAITDEMARRGQGGSGFEFQSQLAAQQSGADRDAKNRLSVAAQAQDRALQSIMQAGELGGQIGNQDFQRQSAIASAKDKINQFNTSNLQDVQQRNTTALNSAQAANLAAKQKVADNNVNLANQEQEHNKELLQQQYDNQLKLAQSKSNALTGQAQTALDSGKNLGNLYSNIGSAGAGVANAYANQNYWDNYFSKQKKA
jgi:hypothetical protein